MSYTAVDLFAGAGGLSCGFANAGINILAAVEKDLWAGETYAENHTDTKLFNDDIFEIPESSLIKFKDVDIVMGGPPCQGFSISASNRRNPNDPRNLLYIEFLRLAGLLNPKVILIENVKEITKFKLQDGSLLCKDIHNRLSRMGYYSEDFILNAQDYGIPQTRVRAFIVGVKKNLIKTDSKLEKLFKKQYSNASNLTIWDAISDLPPVIPRMHNEEDILEYSVLANNSYQKLMREDSYHLYNHIPMRHTPRMIERFEYILKNGYRNIELPGELGPRARGNPEVNSGKTYHQNHRSLEADKPSPTITASFYSSFVHPYQARNLTVREAARIQSFPDTFRFKGKRTTLSKKLLAKKGVTEDLFLDQFNQVGNAVPPLLAQRLAITIKEILSNE